jgi:VanZ family protein
MPRPPLPFVATLLVSMLVLFTPGGEVPSGPWWSDDVVHVTLFAILTATGTQLPARRCVLAFWLIGYAGLSEVVQAVAPLQRTGSIPDMAADVAGIALGLIGVYLAGRLVRRARTATRAD